MFTAILTWKNVIEVRNNAHGDDESVDLIGPPDRDKWNEPHSADHKGKQSQQQAPVSLASAENFSWLLCILYILHAFSSVRISPLINYEIQGTLSHTDLLNSSPPLFTKRTDSSLNLIKLIFYLNSSLKIRVHVHMCSHVHVRAHTHTCTHTHHTHTHTHTSHTHTHTHTRFMYIYIM